MTDTDISGLQSGLFTDIVPSEDLGPVPEFRWIPKDKLVIDSRYQRSLTQKKSRATLRKLIEDFEWSKFQPITVSSLTDGHFAVIDGQYRGTAAINHPKVELVPCWVVEAASVMAQADVFVGVNNDRTNMTGVQIYRAQLAACDPDAVQVDKVCKAANIVVATQTQPGVGLPPRHTMAIATIRKIIKLNGEKLAIEALRVLAKAHPNTPDQVRSEVIKGLSVVIAAHGKRLDIDRLIAVVGQHNCDQLLEAARAYKKMAGGSTQAAIAHTIARLYDKGLAASNRLAPQTARAA